MVINIIKSKYDETYDISDISLVWFTKTLQNDKAILIDNGKNNRMYEVTYNGFKDEMYVDTYVKVDNIKFNEVFK